MILVAIQKVEARIEAIGENDPNESQWVGPKGTNSCNQTMEEWVDAVKKAITDANGGNGCSAAKIKLTIQKRPNVPNKELHLNEKITKKVE
jgi:hypothetical protein